MLTPGFLRVLDASISPGYGATFGLPFSPATLRIANAGPVNGSDVGIRQHFGFDMADLDDLMISKPVLFDVPEAVPDHCDTQASTTCTRHQSQLANPELAAVPPAIVIEDFIGLEDDVDAMAAELLKLAAPSCDEYELPSFDPPPAVTSVSSLRTNDADAPMTPAVRTPRGGGTVCRSRHPATSTLAESNARSAICSYTAARNGRTSTSSGKKPPPNPSRKKTSTQYGKDNRNCWLLWLQEHRGIAAEKQPHLTSNELMVNLSQMWEMIPAHDKLKWQMMSLFRTEVQSRRDALPRCAN